MTYEMDEKKQILYFKEDSCDITFWLKDKSTKQYLDITGYAFTMAMSSIEDPDDPDTAPTQFSLTGVVRPDQTVGSPDRGAVDFTPSSTDTKVEEGWYYFDTSYILDGKKKTIIKNKIWF